MKKSLIALAVLGAFSGAALAQSNVTLYGIVDVAVRWDDTPTTVTSGGVTTVTQESVTGIQSGHQSGSRFGIRGSEALGGGLSAIFTLEQGFNVDTGQGSSTRQFHRQAFVGLNGGLGSVVAGRLALFSSGTGSFDMIGRVDPFGTGFSLAGAQNTFYSMNATRADNTIAYVSPVWGGFRGGIGWSANLAGAEVPEVGGAENTDVIFAGAQWAGGPFFAAITYDTFNNVAAGASDQKHLQVGGTFDIAGFRLHAAYATQDDVSVVTGASGSFLATPTGATFDSDSWLLGVTWNIGAFSLLASYQALDADGQTITVGTLPVNYEPDYSIWAIGGTYALSRRTNFYASYATRDADGTLNSNSFDADQFAFGIRHQF